MGPARPTSEANTPTPLLHHSADDTARPLMDRAVLGMSGPTKKAKQARPNAVRNFSCFGIDLKFSNTAGLPLTPETSRVAKPRRLD